MADPQTVPVRSKLAFGVGASAEAICLVTFGAFAMFYYNQVLGVPATLAGLAPTLALLADAVTDPLMGSICDRFRSTRWGRRHPFMFAAPIPVALSYFAIFNPPDDLSPGWLFAWFTTFAILLRSFMTLFNVPHLALGSELSRSYTERSRVMSYNNFFGWIGGAGSYWAALTFAFGATAEYANGLLNPHAYPGFAATAAVIVAVILYASAWFTRDRIPTLPKTPEDLPAFGLRTFFADLLAALSNRNYLFLLLGFFFLSVMLGVRSGLGLYVNTYYWELVPSQIRYFVIGTFVGYVTGFAFTTIIHRRFDKRVTIVVTAIALSVFPAMPVILRMIGWFPDNHAEALLPVFIVFSALGSASGSILNISVMSALSDVADENELRIGHRQEGILYSARSFFAKADQALGHFIAGVSLDLIGFPQRAKPGTVDAETLWYLGIVDSPATVVPGLIACAFYARYRIDRARHEEMQRGLAAKRTMLG
jgi:Na+/melibiose symporter-like transporter